MRSFRSKPVGWRGESYRHYLAAKGVRTRYNASIRSKIADKVDSAHSKDILNREVKGFKNLVDNSIYVDGAVYESDVVAANRKGLRKSIRRRREAKDIENLEPYDLDIAVYRLQGGLLGHKIRAMSDEELNEEKKKLENEIEQQYFPESIQLDDLERLFTTGRLENDVAVLKEFDKEIRRRNRKFFAYKNLTDEEEKFFENLFERYPRLKLKRDKAVRNIGFEDGNYIAFYPEEKLIAITKEMKKAIDNDDVGWVKVSMEHELTHAAQEARKKGVLMKNVPYKKNVPEWFKELNVDSREDIDEYEYAPYEVDAQAMGRRSNRSVRPIMPRGEYLKTSYKGSPKHLEKFREDVRGGKDLKKLKTVWE